MAQTPEEKEALRKKAKSEKAAREFKARQDRDAFTKAKAEAGIEKARKRREAREAKKGKSK